MDEKVQGAETADRVGGKTASFSRSFARIIGPNWETLPARWTLQKHATDPLPPQLAEMIGVAEELARPFEFLRVDFYLVDGKLYIGELTNYPGAGFEKFIPGSYANVIGAYWKRTPTGVAP